jgi:uncharacterized membrane protein YkvA (DUF1232 family)
MDVDIVNSAEISEQHLPGADHKLEPRDPAVSMTWRQQAQRVHLEAHVFYFAFKHPRTRWYAKLVAVCTAGYLLSPIQLIPSFIPVIGFLDDLLVLFLGVKLLQRITPSDVLAECRELAKAAETRRKEEIRSSAAVFASVAIVTLWLLATVTASALVVAYIPY